MLSFDNKCDRLINIVLFLIIPIGLSFCALFWMKKLPHDSINQGVEEIITVNNDYLPVYLGYIFIAISLPERCNGQIDWITCIVVYSLICIFLTSSKALCFNPVFVVFGYNFYQVKTPNKIKLYVITKKKIKKGDKNITFPSLTKITEFVYLDIE